MSLLNHLHEHYAPYIDNACYCPKYQVRKFMTDAAGRLAYLSEGLGKLPAALAACLQSYSQSLTDARLTYRSLDYFQVITTRLAELDYGTDHTEHEVHELLLQYNFNELGYFAYLQQRLQDRLAGLPAPERLEFLRAEYAAVRGRPAQNQLIYHPDWPPLKQMLAKFIGEEIKHLGHLTGPVSCKEKVPLHLSVAQLACWLKLFQEEGLFATENLSDIFRSAAQTYRTKRQDQISAHSLSKEYYAISQVTAAVTRDQLLKMVARINREFFPV
jgi:hypothetical protein